MAKLRNKIATSVILASCFIIVSFMALNYDNLDPSLVAIIILLMIFVVSFAIASSQKIVYPVKKLLDGSEQIESGNLSNRIYLETKDELSELANIFNNIADELERSKEQSKSVNESVSIKVKARTKDLEETISALEQKVENRTIELKKMIAELNKYQEAEKNKTATLEQPKNI
jgi:nitrate/nitrite-specific signal transduction histidine kinase